MANFNDPDAVQDEIERWLKQVERLISGHHGDQLTAWTSNQQRSIEQTADADAFAFAQQEASSMECIQNILGDVEEQRIERNRARAVTAEFRAERDHEFAEELRSVGEVHSQQASELVRTYTSKVRAIGEAWDANAWDRLDRALGTITWQQARQVHATNPTAGVADVYMRGELDEYLVSERDGWNRSQKNDLERLQQEIQQESENVFKNLQSKLKRMAPEALLVKPWANQLTEMAKTESERLNALEQEVVGAYESEIDAAMWQCEEDYRGYDAELQRILFRSLDERVQSAAQMREMKLALCRWRLDYQRHYQFNLMTLGRDLGDRRSTNTMMTTVRQTGARRFLMVRKLLRRLWMSGRLPSKEIHSFLSKVSDHVAKNDKEATDSMRALYESEIRKYGATALIEHASNKKTLDIFMAATKPLPPKGKSEEEQQQDQQPVSMQIGGGNRS